MSLSHSPKIVTNGLTMCLDAKNIKSYSGSGNTWIDVSGNGYYATKSGDGSVPSFNTSGHFDYSANSPAETSTAWGGNGFYLNNIPVPTIGSFTVTVSIRRDTSQKALGDRETIFSNAGGAEGFRFGISSNDLYYLIGGTGGAGYQEGGLGINAPVANAQWHIITVVFDRAAQLGSYKVYGYVDSSYSSSVTINAGASGNSAFPATPNSSWGPGYGGCCDAYAGYIGAVLTYNKALTPSEVAQNFNALRGRYSI